MELNVQGASVTSSTTSTITQPTTVGVLMHHLGDGGTQQSGQMYYI